MFINHYEDWKWCKSTGSVMMNFGAFGELEVYMIRIHNKRLASVYIYIYMYTEKKLIALGCV